MRDILSSLEFFKKSLQTTSYDGEVRYNADLLPSPPGKQSPQLTLNRELMQSRGSTLGMAALLLLLSDDDLQSQ